MSTRMIRMAVIVCLVMTCCFASTSAANETQDQVREALAKMHAWVGENANGQQWKKYLRSSDLLAELEKGDDANSEVVDLALQRYRSTASGLDKKRFTEVRNALSTWHEELTLPEVGSLAEVARSMKASYQPVTETALTAARVELSQRVDELDNYLTPGGKNGDAWKSYLKWEALRAQSAKDAKVSIPEIDGVYRQLRKNNEGLELDVFQNAATSLESYYGLAAAHSNPKTGEIFSGQLERLATSLEQYAATPTEYDNTMIGSRIGWLEISGQTPELIRAVRAHYSHPNLWVQVSERFINAGMSRTVDERRPVTDNILGTYITGEGHTVGKVSVDLKPNKRSARFDTILTGNIETETVGSNGPVFIYSESATKIRAVKRVTLDKLGLHAKKAKCDASTNSEVTGISTTRNGRVGDRMIQRIAWRKIGQQHSQSEEIGAEHAEARVAKAVDKDAKESLAESQKDFEDKYRNPLIRRGQFPKMLRFHTSDDHLFVTALQANRYQLGAPNNPPNIGNAKNDIVVRVHESMMNNLAGGLLAGRTYTDSDLAKLGERLGDEWKEKLESPEDEDPWSITFANARPVTFSFGTNQYTVTIRGQQFTSGDRTFKSMNIVATYTMEKTDTGAKLTRQGDINILPPNFVEGTDKLSASQVALRRILARRMEELFPAEIIGKAKPLEGDWAKVGTLKLDEMASAAGWLTLGWNAPEIDRLSAKASSRTNK